MRGVHFVIKMKEFLVMVTVSFSNKFYVVMAMSEFEFVSWLESTRGNFYNFISLLVTIKMIYIQ